MVKTLYVDDDDDKSDAKLLALRTNSPTPVALLRCHNSPIFIVNCETESNNFAHVLNMGDRQP